MLADDDSELELEPEVVAAEDSVEAVEESVLVELVAEVVKDPVADPVLAVPVLDAVEADATPVPVAPSIPKLGEKLMLEASVSSMISMV